MESRTYALAAGLFVVLLVGLLSAGALWLSGPHVEGLPYDLITEQSVAGLAAGTSVRLRGVEVGRVDSIGFDPRDRRLVRVRIQVDPHVPLMAGTYATLGSLGLSGSAFVELNYPDDATHVLVTSAYAPARIPMRPSGLAALTESGDEMLTDLRGTLRRMDAMLTPQNSEHISELIVRFDTAAGELVTLGHDLTPATRRLDGLLADVDRAVNSTQSTMSDADSLVVQVRGRVDALDALRDSAHDAGQAVQTLQRTLTGQTLPQIEALAQHLSRNSDTLERLLQQISAQPQSVIFGLPSAPPGPGEPGFRSAQR